MRIWEDSIGIDIKGIVVNTRDSIDWIKGRNYCKALLIASLNYRVLYISYKVM